VDGNSSAKLTVTIRSRCFMALFPCWVQNFQFWWFGHVTQATPS